MLRSAVTGTILKRIPCGAIKQRVWTTMRLSAALCQTSRMIIICQPLSPTAYLRVPTDPSSGSLSRLLLIWIEWARTSSKVSHIVMKVAVILEIRKVGALRYHMKLYQRISIFILLQRSQNGFKYRIRNFNVYASCLNTLALNNGIFAISQSYKFANPLYSITSIHVVQQGKTSDYPIFMAHPLFLSSDFTSCTTADAVLCCCKK